MKIKSIFGGAITGLILSHTPILHAASISFSNTSVTAELGDLITLDVLMDFTGDPTLGGGTDIFYDASVLSYQSFGFTSTSLALDTDFSRSPDVLSNELEGLSFGNFNGLSGPGVVGTLTFQVIAFGDVVLSMAETDNLLAGGAFTSATTFTSQAVNFGTAGVTIVPVPAAVWLFGSGLIGLVGVAKRSKA